MIHQLTPTARLVVDYQDYPSNPREDDTCLVTFVEAHESYQRFDVQVLGAAGASTDAASIDWYRARGHFADDDLLARWVRIFHPEVAAFEHDYEYGGFWVLTRTGINAGFRYTVTVPATGVTTGYDYTDEVIAGTYNEGKTTARSILEGEAGLYRKWARGEVYDVTLERPGGELYDPAVLVPLEDVDADESAIQWGAVETIGGFYESDDELEEVMAAFAALDYFDLSDAETAAARTMANLPELVTA